MGSRFGNIVDGNLMSDGVVQILVFRNILIFNTLHPLAVANEY